MKKFDFNIRSAARKSTFFMPAIILLIIGIAVLGYFQIPGYEKKEVSQLVAKAVIESSFDYEVKANADTILWAAGDIMGKGMPLYFLAVNPLLSVYPSVKTDDFQYENGTVVVDVYLESLDREGTPYWSEVVKSRQERISPGKSSIAPFRFNILELYVLVGEITRDLNFNKGNHRLLLSLEAQLDGVVTRHSISFALENDGIMPPADELTSYKEIFEEGVEKIMVARTFNDYLRCGYFWIYAGSITILLVIALLGYNTEQKSEYERYKNLISKAVLTADKEPDAYFSSLKELIEMAVELDKKVIFDETRGGYYILDGDKRYVYKEKPSHAAKKGASAKGSKKGRLLASALGQMVGHD